MAGNPHASGPPQSAIFQDDAQRENANPDYLTARQPVRDWEFADDAQRDNSTYNINPETRTDDLRKPQRSADLKIPGGNWKFPLEQSAQYDGRIRFFVFEQKPLSLEMSSVLPSWIEDKYANLQAARAYLKKGSSAEVSNKKVEVFGSGDKSNSTASGTTAGGSINSVGSVNQNSKQIKEDSVAFERKAREGGVNNDFLTFQHARPRRWVDMYIPISIQIDDNVQYDNAQLGIMGQALLSGMAQTGEVMSAIGKSMSEGVADVFNLFGGNLGGEAARLAAIRASGKLPKIQNAVSVSQQRAINPNVRAIFRGVNLRQFSFTFKMIPTSAREAMEISNIIRFFRIEVYPESKVVGNHGSVMYKFPNVFDISFKYGSANAKIPRLNYCFLTGVQSNFNPTQAAFHQGGYPAEVDLTLRFLEVRTLDKSDVLDQHKYQGAPGSREEIAQHQLSPDMANINST